jgi:hypothetical protein
MLLDVSLAGVDAPIRIADLSADQFAVVGIA